MADKNEAQAVAIAEPSVEKPSFALPGATDWEAPEVKEESPKEGEAITTEEPKAEEPKPKVEPSEETPQAEEKPAEEPKTEPKAEVLLAGRFKTPEDLEVAYIESSKEGRRLNAELVQAKQRLAGLEQKLESYELEKELGSFKELTKEELLELMNSEDAEDRLAAQEYIADKKLYGQKKASLEKMRKDHEANSKRHAEELRKAIDARFDELKGNPKEYPNFASTIPLMHEMADAVEDRLGGMVNGIEAYYLMALGYTYREALKKGEQKTSEEVEKAKKEAEMKARISGSGGHEGTNKIPTGKEDDNDEAYGEAMRKAYESRNFTFG